MKNIILLAVFAGSAFAQLQPCNLAQLAGDTDLFSISGGNGTFAPGSNQIIVWDSPEGSQVRRIRQNVTIVDTVLGTSTTPDAVTGVPVVFRANETGTHLTGEIGVTLPADIAPGDNYTFRVTLRSRGSLCFLDTAQFSVSAPPATCTPGEMHCTDDLTGFTQCVETDDTATSFSFSDPISCAATTVCIETSNTTIACVAPPPIDQCTLGETRCSANSDASETCVLDDSTGTTMWEEAVPCATGFSCDASTGLCTADVPPPVDECVLGSSECVTTVSNRQCVLNDATNTTVWTDPATCPSGTTCDADTGLCSSGTPPLTGCEPHSQVCLTSTTFDECIHNQDGVWSFGGVTLNCPAGSVCTPYINNTINCVPEPVTTLRRRLTRGKRSLF